MSKLFYFLLQCAIVLCLGMAIVYTFYRADHLPDPDTAFLKTLGFWAVALVAAALFRILVTLMKIRSTVGLLVSVALTGALCWAIYWRMM